MANEPLMPEASASRRFSPLRTLWQHRIDPKTYLGLHLTITLVIAAASIWLFATLLDGILDNAILVRWDIAVDAAIHTRMTALDLSVVNLVTQLGSPPAMGVLLVGGAIWLWRAKRHTMVMGWVAAFVGGVAINQALKMAVHRTRPAYGAAYLHGPSFSFPSGHAMGSLIGYGMAGYILQFVWRGSPRAHHSVNALLFVMIVAVGLSRVLLGVHYPSDVVGGWAAGGAWMSVCVVGIGVAEQRRIDRSRAT